jgi:hypothetical protein
LVHARIVLYFPGACLTFIASYELVSKYSVIFAGGLLWLLPDATMIPWLHCNKMGLGGFGPLFF